VKIGPSEKNLPAIQMQQGRALSLEKIVFIAESAIHTIKIVFSTILSLIFPKYFNAFSVVVNPAQLPVNREGQRAELESMQKTSRQYLETMCRENRQSNEKLASELLNSLIFEDPDTEKSFKDRGMDALGSNVTKGYIKLNDQMKAFIKTLTNNYTSITEFRSSLNHALESNQFGHADQLVLVNKLKMLNALNLSELTEAQQQAWANELRALEIFTKRT
jgi:hypothetical protein